MTELELLERAAWQEALNRSGWSAPLYVGQSRGQPSGAEQCGKGKCIRDEGHHGKCFEPMEASWLTTPPEWR